MSHEEALVAGRVLRRRRYPLAVRSIEVSRVEKITARMRRVIFTGRDLKGFVSSGFDDHVKLFLPAEGGGRTLNLPIVGTEGVIFPEGVEQPVMRDYTPRHFDPTARELTIDFLLHGEGPATRWAAAASAGDKAGVGGPRGSILIPADFGTHLLIGDESALPAIGRRLEELDSTSSAVVVAEVEDESDAFDLKRGPNIAIHWVFRRRRGGTLSDAVRQVKFSKYDCFAWIACESAAAKEIRRHLIGERGFNPHLVKASGYWRRHASAVHEVFSE